MLAYACDSLAQVLAALCVLLLQESKNGHALLRKVKVLTDENEDLGRQQREGVQAAQVRGHAVAAHLSWAVGEPVLAA